VRIASATGAGRVFQTSLVLDGACRAAHAGALRLRHVDVMGLRAQILNGTPASSVSSARYRVRAIHIRAPGVMRDASERAGRRPATGLLTMAGRDMAGRKNHREEELVRSAFVTQRLDVPIVRDLLRVDVRTDCVKMLGRSDAEGATGPCAPPLERAGASSALDEAHVGCQPDGHVIEGRLSAAGRRRGLRCSGSRCCEDLGTVREREPLMPARTSVCLSGRPHPRFCRRSERAGSSRARRAKFWPDRPRQRSTKLWGRTDSAPSELWNSAKLSRNVVDA